MKQKVHSVSYLAKAEFKFKVGTYDLVALPAGAEVVKLSLEVVGDINDGSLGLGFKSEAESSYFLSLNASSFNNKDDKTVTLARDYTITSNKVIVAEVKNANNNDTKGVLRVLYFLPSVIEVEY
ncbi:hypothetical protein HpCHN30_12040 [Helicobacter pylori]|nr:hypothetical protein KVL12_03640 [Helicobacter pylori]